ncbi:MAG: Rid family detoxifying hydrolase [Planctomycetota bacterium]
MKTILSTNKAPAPVGPYVQGTGAGGFLFTAGQLGMDPATGKMCAPTFREQAVQALKNVETVLAAGGATLADVVKVNVYVADLSKFGEFNEAYKSFFREPFPARTTVEANLPAGGLVEVDAVAWVGKE